MSVGEIDFSTLRDVRERGDSIVAEGRIDHAPGVIENHFFEQRPAESLCDCPFDLRAALHRIDDHAAVGAVNALQDRDLAGDAIDRDAKALDLEGDAARSAVSLANYFELTIRLARGREKFRQRDARIIICIWRRARDGRRCG